MHKKIIHWALLAIFFLGTICCKSPAPTAPSVPPYEYSNFDENFELRASSSWVSPQAINFHIEVKNRTNKEKSLEFGSTELYDIQIFDSSGGLVWNLSYGKLPLTVLYNILFKAGESVSYDDEWKLTDNYGWPLPKGSIYTAVVVLKCVWINGEEINSNSSPKAVFLLRI